MRTYTPDCWVIVEISGSEVEMTYHRVLAGWYGGFAAGDSWKLSSGITKIVESDGAWEVHNESGSIYQCAKSAQRLSGYTQSIYASYASENSEKAALNIVTLDSIRSLYV